MAEMDIRIDPQGHAKTDSDKVVKAQDKILRKTKTLIMETIALGRTSEQVYNQMVRSKMKAQSGDARNLKKFDQQNVALRKTSLRLGKQEYEQYKKKVKVEKELIKWQKKLRHEYVASGQSLKDYINKEFKSITVKNKETKAIHLNTIAKKANVRAQVQLARLTSQTMSRGGLMAFGQQQGREQTAYERSNNELLGGRPQMFTDASMAPVVGALNAGMGDGTKAGGMDTPDIIKQKGAVEGLGNAMKKTSRRSSILNSRLGNFFVIMTGISGTIFVFQKLYQWVRDFTNVTMKAEEALVKLNMEASITKDMLTDIGQISKITGASGIIATEKATEKIQKYIQEGYSATESTQLLGQEISKLNTAYDGTLTGAMSRLKGIFVDIAATIGEKIRPGLTQLSKDVSTYQEREWQETFWENESRLQTSINQKKIGADFWMASKDRGKTVKQLQEALLDLRTKYFYEKDLREHNVGFDARELGNAGADIRANKSDAEYLKSLGKEWKKLKDDKVKYYGMTDYKKELAIHNKLYNSLRKLSEQNIAMRAEQDQWNQVEKAQIWMKYFKYPTDAISDHEKERLNLSDPRATTHDTTLAMRKFRDNQFKGLKEGEMSDHEKIRLGLKDLPIMSPTEIDKILDHIREKNKRTAEEMLADSRIWTDGVKRGLDDYATAATNAGKNAEITITNGFKNMEDALVEFVTKGKISFSGLVDSMLVDMARMAIKENITGQLAAGLSGALGAYFTPTASNMNNITAQPGPRAAGGTVSPYTSYLVGEKGREVLEMGSSGGYITPNNKLGSA
ncbi:MAG: hypothetical protein HQ551_13370, partial [Desulfobacteraceae bacterium]|nr:hypothetical protein [Desulfobacteraceae bacterium]